MTRPANCVMASPDRRFESPAVGAQRCLVGWSSAPCFPPSRNRPHAHQPGWENSASRHADRGSSSSQWA